MGKHQAKGPPAGEGVRHPPQASAGRTIRQRVRPGRFGTLLAILDALEAANITHTLTRYRPDAVSIQAAVPGERWEIDVTEDGEVDFERFVSTGSISDRADLDTLIARHSDNSEATAG